MEDRVLSAETTAWRRQFEYAFRAASRTGRKYRVHKHKWSTVDQLGSWCTFEDVESRWGGDECEGLEEA